MLFNDLLPAALVLLGNPGRRDSGHPRASVLDQSAAANSCNSVVSNTQSLSETFTAGLTGQR